MEKNFKTYIGTKTVKAMPMTYHEAGQKGLIREYKKDVKEQCGYCVQYADGYKSWSPANVFEEAYKVSETYVDRMKIELADLNEKICKATKAIYTLGMVEAKSRSALSEQLSAMRGYAEILYWRIYDAESSKKNCSSESQCAGREGKR